MRRREALQLAFLPRLMPQWNLDELPPALRERILAQMQAESPAVPAAAAEEPRKPNPAERRREVKELHDPFRNWLELHKIPYVYPRADQKSSIRVGWPDFTVLARGRVCCVEFKWPGEKLRPEQQGVHAWLQLWECPVIVAFSFEEARAFVVKTLELRLTHE